MWSLPSPAAIGRLLVVAVALAPTVLAPTAVAPAVLAPAVLVDSRAAPAPSVPAAPGAARSGAPTTTVARGRFDWPLTGRPAVTRRFDPPDSSYGPGHRGVDLAGRPGQPVLAAGAGVVVFAGPLAGRGVVSVDHPGGLRTTYEPVTAVVRPGQLVRAGEELGVLEAGHPGCPVEACLHWGLRRGPDYLDPLLLLGGYPVRLLPWGDGL